MKKSLQCSADIVFIAPLGAPERRVRLTKVIETLGDRHDVTLAYWGWRRSPDETLGDGFSNVTEHRVLLSGGGFRNFRARLMYILWAWRVFWAVLRRRPKKIYCLGLETALPVWLAKQFRSRIRYVFDDADRLVMVWKLPKVGDAVLRWCEKRTSRASISHVIPCRELYDFDTPNMRLVRNMPNLRQIQVASRESVTRRSGKLIVYVNGTLNETRNLSAIAESANLLRQSGDTDIIFTLATGKRIDGWDGHELADNVVNLGWLPQVRALAQYRVSDVVLTFCDTSAVPSYRFAWPNKWGDAISMATPIIVNPDMVTARSLLDEGVAIACPFGDGAALAALLIELRDDPERLNQARAAFQNVRSQFVPYDEAIEPVLSSLLHDGG